MNDKPSRPRIEWSVIPLKSKAYYEGKIKHVQSRWAKIEVKDPIDENNYGENLKELRALIALAQ